jgi:hypothetical protein
MKQFLALMLLIASLYGCNLYPDDDARVDEFDGVITYYDRTANFGEYKTFVMIDSVADLNSTQSGVPNETYRASQNSDYILGLIRGNMLSRGYTEVVNYNDADLVINAGVVSVSNFVISGSYPPYYWGYPGTGWGYPGDWWGYPGYGYYYPWVPIAFVSEYEVGTLLIDMIDRKNYVPSPNPSNDLLIKWAGIIRGVTNLTGQADVRNRLRIDIDIAFDQSPYLKTNL